MGTRFMTAAAAVALLMAGAFAMAPVGSGSAQAVTGNVTFIEKNQDWPIKGRVSVEPCRLADCEEI